MALLLVMILSIQVKSQDGNCEPTLTVTENVTAGNTDIQHASETIIAQNVIEAEAEAAYKAGQSVTMGMGFHAQVDADFTATLENCVINETFERWSNPATWPNNTKPVAGQEVMIPEGKHILLDENPPALGGLTIAGTLEFARQDLQLTSEWIMVMGGLLEVGTEQLPFEQKAIITLNDTDTGFNMGGFMGTRGIAVMNGGALELHGATPDVLWTKLGAHAADGTTSLTLAESVQWNVNDEVVIGPTDFYHIFYEEPFVTQSRTLTAVNGTQLSLNAQLVGQHWGTLQYAASDGISTTNANIIDSPIPDEGDYITPKVLDERAPIGNLTRNIVVQAPDDALWNEQLTETFVNEDGDSETVTVEKGFGVHIMAMIGTTSHLDG